MISRDARNLRKLKAIRRAEFALKQRLERIDWDEDVLLPEVAEFEARAQLPELPEENIVSVEWVDDPRTDRP